MDDYITKEKAVDALRYVDDELGILRDSELYVHFAEQLCDLPSADVVEAVRCKDCEFFRPQAGWDGGQCSYLEDRFDLFEVLMFDDDYCSDGERKER